MAAKEISGGCAPTFFTAFGVACSHWEKIGNHSRIGVLLRKNSVVDILFNVIGILLVAGPAIEIIGGTNHVVHGAMLLIILPYKMWQFPFGNPMFATILASGAE